MHAYRHGVIDQRLPASGEPLPPDWALQDPDDYVESMTAAVRGALADSGVDAGEVIGIGTDFTACTMVPTLADGTPLCAARRVQGPAARLREAVEAPRGPTAGRSHQRRSPPAAASRGWRATAG